MISGTIETVFSKISIQLIQFALVLIPIRERFVINNMTQISPKDINDTINRFFDTILLVTLNDKSITDLIEKNISSMLNLLVDFSDEKTVKDFIYRFLTSLPTRRQSLLFIVKNEFPQFTNMLEKLIVLN